MTRPMSEPNNWQTLSHYGWRIRQLERRPGAATRTYEVLWCSSTSIVTSTYPPDAYIFMPTDMAGARLFEAAAAVVNASSSGDIEINIYLLDKSDSYNDYALLTDYLTIDESENDSYDSAVTAAPVTNAPQIEAGDFIVAEIVSPGTGAMGLQFTLTFAA